MTPCLIYIDQLQQIQPNITFGNVVHYLSDSLVTPTEHLEKSFLM